MVHSGGTSNLNQSCNYYYMIWWLLSTGLMTKRNHAFVCNDAYHFCSNDICKWYILNWMLMRQSTSLLLFRSARGEVGWRSFSFFFSLRGSFFSRCLQLRLILRVIFSMYEHEYMVTPKEPWCTYYQKFICITYQEQYMYTFCLFCRHPKGACAFSNMKRIDHCMSDWVAMEI